MLVHKKNMLNMLLAIIVSSLAVALYLSWGKELPSLPVLSAQEKKMSTKKNITARQSIPVESNYRAVTDKNLFSPDRKEYIPEPESSDIDAEQVQTLTRISGKAVELHGVMQIGDRYTGLVYKQDNGADKKYKWVEVGDRISNLKVAEIGPDRLLLRDGGKKYELKLSDAKKERRPTSSNTKVAPTIVSTGTPSKSNAAPAKTREDNDNDETTIIHTPFGDIIRKK